MIGKSEEQKAAEATVERFRRNLGPFVVAAERTRMPMVFTDAKAVGNPIIFANPSFVNLTGSAPEEVLGEAFSSLLSRDVSPDASAQVEAAFEGRANGDLEVCFRRKDGNHFWAAVSISPVQDESGSVVQHLASFIDRTKQKAGEAHSRMLIEELNHRVKNTLSTVQAIVRQAVRGLSEPVLIFQEAIESRLFALSRSHDLLTEESWDGAGLRDLIGKALEPFGAFATSANRFIISGKDTRLSPKVALALGIAFHELAANAMTHGALSNGQGSVLIQWALENGPDGSLLVLRWHEQGGPPVTAPSRKGFGALILERGLAHELGGTVHLDYRSDGLVCTMEIPAMGACHG